MKDKIVYICLLILLSTSCKEQTFQADDIILHCYDSKYQKEGYDIKTIIDDYEKLLIKEGILRDNSGKSYLEVMQKINSDKDFSIASSTFMDYDPFLKVDNETKLALFECENEMIELAKEKDSRWHKLSVNLESPELKENPDLIYQDMVEALSENELDSYYFRLKMFHLFDMVNSKWGNRSLMPTVSTE
ncbi:hypothetical protein [Muriicola sp.]|uniref:hypothetical protein n=1 Tax=Muriicola sp. TaxID=2020856 RepID=UPI003C723BD8